MILSFDEETGMRLDLMTLEIFPNLIDSVKRVEVCHSQRQNPTFKCCPSSFSCIFTLWVTSSTSALADGSSKSFPVIPGQEFEMNL